MESPMHSSAFRLDLLSMSCHRGDEEELLKSSSPLIYLSDEAGCSQPSVAPREPTTSPFYSPFLTSSNPI